MDESRRISPKAAAAILAFSSLFAGMLNGLLGTGGGMVLIFVLGMLLGRERGKDAFVLSSVGILVFSLVSVATYGAGGSLYTADLPRFSLAAALGAVGGALLLNRVKLFWLRKLFGVILVYSGLKMVGLF